MSERSADGAWMSLVAGLCLLGPGVAQAAGYDPYAVVPRGPIEVDMAAAVARPRVSPPQAQPDLKQLDQAPVVSGPGTPGQPPPGWVQVGEVVQREEVAFGLQGGRRGADGGVGGPRGQPMPAQAHPVPQFQRRVAVRREDDFERTGETRGPARPIRPSARARRRRWRSSTGADGHERARGAGRVPQAADKMVPYTMVMIGGQWQDTNIDMPAGGVAPGTDCEARGQRHL